MRGLYDCIKEDKMTEEEIIRTLENRINLWNNIREDCKNSELSNEIEQIEKDNQATQGLIDIYNKQKEEIEKQQNKIASQEKQIKLMQSCDLSKVIKEQEKIIMEQEIEIDKYKKQEFGNLFNGRYISKDKIRDKILELTGIKGELEEKDFGIGFTLEDYYKEITIKIKAYKELLEE